LEFLRSKGFRHERVYEDPQSALKSLVTKFKNVAIDIGGASDYIPKVNVKIRCIKEHPSVKNSLPWSLPPNMVKDLVAYVVSRIIMEQSAVINQPVAPNVLFTGMWVDFHKEYRLTIGDYCGVYDGMDNTSKLRSTPCIVLYPCNNAAGSWTFMNLLTKQKICCSLWLKMVTTDIIVAQMNTFNKGSEPRVEAGVRLEEKNKEEEEL
jgi:hypothetical protein